MLPIPPEPQQRDGAFLAERGVGVELRPHFLNWLRYYLDVCRKYALDFTDKRSFPPFGEKLKAKPVRGYSAPSWAQRQPSNTSAAMGGLS